MCCCFQPTIRSDLSVSSPESHSILATAAQGEGSTRLSEEDASYSPSAIREDITATSDIPQLPFADEAIDSPSTRSLGTEHIKHSPPDSIAVELTASRDIEVPSSPSPAPVFDNLLPAGMLLPLDSAVVLSEPASFSLESHSLMLSPAAGGPSRSCDPSAAVEREDSAKAALCQEKGKGKPHDDITVTSDAPTQLLLPQPIVDVAMAGLSRTSSRSSLDTGKYPSRLCDQYDIV